MELVVPLSESEVGDVHQGQIATVTVEALSGKKLAAHVSEVAILSTTNSGVVSYDVTFVLDQMDAGLKPGMSATAEVVVKQAEGINVPTSAISADTVTVVRGGKHVRQRVVTGLAGNSTTIILSGLTAGETIVLPSTSTTSTSSAARPRPLRRHGQLRRRGRSRRRRSRGVLQGRWMMPGNPRPSRSMRVTNPRRPALVAPPAGSLPGGRCPPDAPAGR